MEDSRWDVVARLFEEAQELKGEARGAYLAAECEGDPALRVEVEAMLGAESRPGFLETPVAAAPGGGGLVGSTIGGFQVLRLLGEGGMGAVYEAEQANPRRRVALKVLRSALASAQVRRRFEVEAELLGRLHHPNIAQVHEAGVHVLEGGFELPYFAMEYVEGARHLTAFAIEERLSLRERLALLADVCDAIAAAHRRGILHRDLKPSNLLVDGEGRVRVIDFGVARAIEDDSVVTRTGELIGTPSYMSPEQLAGRPEEVDAQSDVWALGVILYQLATGVLPFDTREVPISEVAQRLQRAPQRVSVRTPIAPRDLDWVVEKALEPERERRYGTVAELADELRRLLADEAVLAVPASRFYRLRKFARRNRLLVGATTAIALALVVGTIVATLGLFRARTAEAAARKDEKVAQDEAAKFAGINRVLASMFTSIDATELGAETKVIDLLDTSAESLPAELGDQPRVRKALHLVLADSYDSLGQSERALVQAEAVLAIGRVEGPLDEPEERQALEIAASAALGLEDVRRAKGFIEQGRAMLAAAAPGALGRGHALALLAGRVLLFEDDYEGAVEAIRAVHEDSLTLPAGDREVEFMAASLLGSALEKLDRFDEALAVYSGLLAAMEEQSTHPFRLDQVRVGRAQILTQLGRHDEARVALVEALPSLVRLTGESSHATRHALNLLAGVYISEEDPEPARAILESLLEATDAEQDSNDFQVQSARQSLAIARSMLGETQRSTADFEVFLRFARDTYGDESPRVAKALANLAKHLVDRREFERAEELLFEALDIRKRVDSSGSYEMLFIFGVLGEAYFGLGRYEEAYSNFETAWRGYEDVTGADSPLAMSAGSNAVAALSRMGDTKRALPLAETLFDRNRKLLQPNDPNLLVQGLNLALMYEGSGRVPESEALMIAQIASARTNGLSDHPAYADTLFARGRQLLGRALPEEALALFEEALAVHARFTRALPMNEGFLRMEYGRALGGLGRHVAALEQLTAAHRLLSPVYPASAQHMRALVTSIADTLDALDRPAEAETWRERSASGN